MGLNEGLTRVRTRWADLDEKNNVVSTKSGTDNVNEVIISVDGRRTLGAHGVEIRKVRSNMVVDFYRRHNVIVTNIWFKKRKT